MFALAHCPVTWTSSVTTDAIAKHNQGFVLGDDGLWFEQCPPGLESQCQAMEGRAETRVAELCRNQTGRLGTLVISGEALSLEQITRLTAALRAELSLGQCLILRSTFTHRLVFRAAAAVNTTEAVLQQRLVELSKQQNLEAAWLCDYPDLDKPGLLLMDMDSTLIAMECIDELAKDAGVGPQVAEVTEAAMQGQLDFAQSLYQRVACLAGASVDILEHVRQRVPVMAGAENLIRELKARGWKVAIASGGFTFFANDLKTRLGLDAVVANELEVVNYKLTGKVIGQVVDAEVKAQTLMRLAADYGIAPQQTLALGDGANDLSMLRAAALGVAYRAKPLVQEQAQVSIQRFGLDTVLDLLSNG